MKTAFCSAHRHAQLFSPVLVGSLTLKNRLVLAPMGTMFATLGGQVSQRLIDFLVVRAEGGVGLVEVEMAIVRKDGRTFNRQLLIDSDDCIPGLKTLVDRLHQADTKVAIQIGHMGRRARSRVTGRQVIAPSSIPWLNGEVPRELSVQEIEDCVQSFGEAARRAKAAGFDAIEIHAAHGYLIHQFLSPLMNLRRDDYGGSFPKRARFLMEIVRCIRQAVGTDFPLLARISADEFAEGGVDLEESRLTAKMLEAEGIDAISVSAGSGFSLHWTCQPMALPRGCLVDLGNAIKKETALPVMVAGRINNPALAETILEKGQADLIALGRPLLADPEFALKAQTGREDQIRPCIACNFCIDKRLYAEFPVCCAVNPEVGRETMFTRGSTKPGKRILIIGGGPAGMQAAITAIELGHQVTLLEKEGELGGRLRLAKVPPHKEEFNLLLDFLSKQIEGSGVDLHLSREVALTQDGLTALVQQFHPDVLILAFGASVRQVSIPGISQHGVVTAEEVLHDQAALGERVAVFGGGLVGCETAELVASQGKCVTIITRQEAVAQNMGLRTRSLLMERLAEAKIDILSRVIIKEVCRNDAGLTVVYLRGGYEERLEGLHNIILAPGYEPRPMQLEGWEGKPKVIMLGDCQEPRGVAEAINDGFQAAFNI